MSLLSSVDPSSVIGRQPEALTFKERAAATGKFAALEIYSTRTLPLRRIEAIGDSVEECLRQLAGRGLDPTYFEFVRLGPLC